MKPFELSISLLNKEYGHIFIANPYVTILKDLCQDWQDLNTDDNFIYVICKKCNLKLCIFYIDIINDFTYKQLFFKIVDSGKYVGVTMMSNNGIHREYNKISCEEMMIKNLLE